MNTENVKINTALRDTLRKLLNSSTEELNNSKGRIELISSGEMENSTVVEAPTKLPLVNVTTQRQAVSDERKLGQFFCPTDLLEELRYLSKNAMREYSDKRELRIGSIAKRILINYVNEIKDTPIGDFKPYIHNVGYANRISFHLPKNIMEFIRGIAKERNISINSVGVMLLRRALKQAEGCHVTKQPEMINILAPVNTTEKFHEQLTIAASQSSQSIIQYVNDAISELIENSNRVLEPKRFSKIKIRDKRMPPAKICALIPNQMHKKLKRLSLTYKMPMNTIVYTAIASRLGISDETARCEFGIERIPLNNSQCPFRITLHICGSIMEILSQKTPRGMRVLDFVESIILKELVNSKDNPVGVVRKFPYEKEDKKINLTLPEWGRKLLDRVVLDSGAKSYSALLREFLTRWAERQSEFTLDI